MPFIRWRRHLLHLAGRKCYQHRVNIVSASECYVTPLHINLFCKYNCACISYVFPAIKYYWQLKVLLSKKARIKSVSLLLTTWQHIPHPCLICHHTVYPKKYAHGFVVLCFVVVMQSFIMNSHEVFIHIHQGCFAGTGAIVRLPQCQWNKPDGYGKIGQCITTTKHSKAKTVCTFLGIYCSSQAYEIYFHLYVNYRDQGVLACVEKYSLSLAYTC